MLHRSTPRHFSAPAPVSRLRFFVPEDDELGAGNQEQQEKDPGFPANTPVKDMTVEQQAAYHQFHARKHENRVKAFGSWTPEAIAALEKERNDLKAAGLSDTEKAITEAEERGRAEVRQILAAERVRVALERELDGRIPSASALLDLDRSKFVKGDGADTDAIKAWVAANSTETKGQTEQRHVRLGQGRTDEVAPVAGERGKAEAERRFKK